MYRIRITPTAKLLLMPTVKNNVHQGSINLMEIITPTCTVGACSMRNLHASRPFYTSDNRTVNFSKHIFERIMSKINIINYLNPLKHKLNFLGHLLYEEAVDTIDYNRFYKEFKMPDTFHSWFVITELHIWMLMVRCMAEGKEGQVLRNCIVQVMWKDVNKRGSQLRIKESQINPIAIKDQIETLTHQFNGSIIAYDEGITGDDKVLAAAIWRRFLHSACNDPEILEKLVFYVRKQTSLLDKISWKELKMKYSVKWKGLDLINSN